MHVSDTVQRVRIYLNEADQVGGRARYLAALETLRESGATGATALRGMAGFGVSQQLRIAQNSGGHAPVVIEWVDRAERVARILPSLDTLLPDALITIETIQVYRATLRSSGPFGDRSVGELAVQAATTAAPDWSIAQAVQALANSNQTTLPVLEGERLVGSFGAAELTRHQLPTPAVLAALPAATRDQLLERVRSFGLAGTMTTEVLALSADSSILQAAKAMVEWGLDQVPVITREGRFAGIFGIDQALQAAQEARTPTGSAIRDAERPAPIGVLMQGVFQTVLGYAPAAEGLERLFVVGETPLVVIDNGRPLGLLDYANLVRGSDEPLRERLLALAPTNRANRAAIGDLAGDIRVASLPLVELPTLPTTATYDQAIAILREQAVPLIAAVDDQGKLQGLVGRRTLLRALVQESGA